jgi:hypothetical protein
MFGRQLPVQVRAVHRLLHNNQRFIHNTLPTPNALTIERNWGCFKALRLGTCET